jgi:phosphoribosylglycinamide formyltransferase 1
MADFKVAVFISGGGTNLQSIIDYSQTPAAAYQVGCVISSNIEAYGLERTRQANIPALYLNRKEFNTREEYVGIMLAQLRKYHIQLIVLAGFMKKLPEEVVDLYPNRILNIHPALLPAFGGKGLYGIHVHKAVIAAKATITGITIHLVDAHYDTGPIIFQKSIPVLADDTPTSLQQRVLQLEHKYYPQVLNWFATGQVNLESGKVLVPLIKD